MSLRLSVETGGDSPLWDTFVGSAAGGHHAQTSLWARVKAVLGWEAHRLVIRDGDTIVGGVQILTRSTGRLGRVGFAPRGPVLASADDRVIELLHTSLLEFGREHRIRYLKVQPPASGLDVASRLRARAWAPSALEAAPTATVRVDVEGADEEILGRMRGSTRNFVRRSMRKGLCVRVGGEADLEAYRQVVEATSRRQGFVPYPARYYESMWRVFGEQGRACLLVAELDDRLLSSTLLIGFGDTVTYKMGGWTGERTKVRPNETIHFEGMRWARDAGYRYYDFDGIQKTVAFALERGDELPETARRGVAHFKLGFGGDVVLFPSALDTSPYSLLRPAVRIVAPRADRVLGMAHRALGRGEPAAAPSGSDR